MQNEVTGDMLLKFLADTIKGVPVFSTAWTNPDPNTAYAAGNVTVGEHDAVMVVTKATNASKREYSVFIENGMDGVAQAVNGNSAQPYMMVRYRPMSYSNGVVQFSTGYFGRNDTVERIDNTVMIPIKIYGIDFIGGGNKLKTFLARLLKGGERRG